MMINIDTAQFHPGILAQVKSGEGTYQTWHNMPLLPKILFVK